VPPPHPPLLQVLELVNNSIDTMPLYLLEGLEARDFAMPLLPQPAASAAPDPTTKHAPEAGPSGGSSACLKDAMLDDEQRLLAEASDESTATQQLVLFFRRLEVGTLGLSLDLSGIGLTSVPLPVMVLTHLTQLNLSANHLSQLPLSLVELSKLVVLSVVANKEIEWMTPDAIADPDHLVLQLQSRLRDGIVSMELNLTHLRLRLLPANTQEMVAVTDLNAAHNELVALPLDIGDQSTFAQLRRLDVSHNRLRTLPPSLGSILALAHLDCSYNNLKLVPPEVAQCTNLTLLNLKNNPTLESPPAHVVDVGFQACLDYLRELLLSRKADFLNLDRWQFQRVPLNLADYLHISELSMCENDLLVLPEQLSDMKTLKKLDVRHNRLEVLPEAIGAMASLRVLHADENKLKTLPISFPYLPMLCVCTLANNQLTWIPNQVGNMNSVTEFVISGNPLRSPPLDIVDQGTFRILRYLRNTANAEKTNALDLSALGLIALPLMICRQTALTELKLFKNKITDVPVKMARLTNLTRLILSANSISVIPPILQHLTDIRRLYIDDNHLTELTGTCFKLTKLSELRVAGNMLCDLPHDVGRLKDLLLLDLSRNELSTLPHSLYLLTRLAKLRLVHNKFERLPLELAKLLGLEELHIGHNPLIDVPPALCTLPNLRVMQMDACEVLLSPPPEICELGFKDVMAFLYRVYEAQRTMVLDMAWLDLEVLYINPTTLSGLTRLNLSGNKFKTLPQQIPYLTKLKSLTFDENRLVVLPPVLGTITSIDKLSFKGNPVESPPQDIVDRGTDAILSYLRRLYVANLTQSLDLSFQGIAMLHVSICRLDRIHFLSLDDNECETLPREIYLLTGLTELSVQRNRLKELPETIGRMKKLEKIALDFNPTLKLLPPELSNATALIWIGYEGNEILSPGMEVLAKGVRPVLLYLACLLEAVQSKKLVVTAAGLNSFAMYLAARPTCVHLDLSNNYLDIMEPSIMTFVTLTYIDFSYNRIREIPFLIGNLRELITLKVDGNLLTELPTSMGFIESLEILTVADNAITALPLEFGNFPALAELNLAGNQMVDLLPELCNVTTLTTINLARNKITSLPADWGVLTRLVQLDVTDNPLVDPPLELRRKGVVHSLHYLRKIRESLSSNVLDLCGLNLQDVASVLDRNHNLLEVHLDNNRIMHLPSLIGRLRRIEVLSITKNPIKILPAELGLCTTLKSLSVDVDVIVSPPHDIIVEDVSVILRYLREFAAAKLTNHLDLTGSKHKEVPAVMMDMTNLTFLSLADNVLEDLPREISTMERLTHLDVSGNKLGSVPWELSLLTNLTYLSIANNQLEFLSRELRFLTKLTEFKIKCQQLWSPPPELHEAGAAPILKFLMRIEEGHQTNVMNLDDCLLIELPDEVLKITSLTQLSCRNNKIKAIPIGMGDLVNLKSLHADHNFIVSITPLMWQLKGLTDVGLSHNNMRSIPPEFGLFLVSNLKRLDLEGCKYLHSPPKEIVARGPPVIIPYLKILWESRESHFLDLSGWKLNTFGETARSCMHTQIQTLPCVF
jgi:Leucine-rich repeat (LRR) protein